MNVNDKHATILSHSTLPQAPFEPTFVSGGARGGLVDARSGRASSFDVRDSAEPGWGDEILLPWIEEHRSCVAELHAWGRPESHAVRFAPDGNKFTPIENLYALGRIIDVLIAPHQPVNDDSELLAWTTGKPWWVGPPAAPSAWRPFCTAIGASFMAESSFHPFFHEVVAVQPSDDPDERPMLVAEHWPGAIVGGLLLVRSGVTVRAGANVLDPQVAARSCLYWSWWRRNRIVRDLSHGWGSNSQWGTDFRRDYIVDGVLHYNVDRVNERSRSANQLEAEDRLDLLRHRCGTRIDFGTEQWPYDETHVEPSPRP